MNKYILFILLFITGCNDVQILTESLKTEQVQHKDKKSIKDQFIAEIRQAEQIEEVERAESAVMANIIGYCLGHFVESDKCVEAKSQLVHVQQTKSVTKPNLDYIATFEDHLDERERPDLYSKVKKSHSFPIGDYYSLDFEKFNPDLVVWKDKYWPYFVGDFVIEAIIAVIRKNGINLYDTWYKKGKASCFDATVMVPPEFVIRVGNHSSILNEFGFFKMETPKISFCADSVEHRKYQ